MSRLSNVLAILVLISGLAVATILYVVYETDRALVLRFSKIQTDENNQPIIYQPGLHFKIPLVDEVKRFDTRSTILDIKASRITTSEKKDVLVDYYVMWRITDFPLFYRRTQGIKSKAEALLEEKANAILKIEFGRLTIKEVVSGERTELMERMRNVTNENSKNLGLEVQDVRVKRIDLPKEVSDSVYTRMRAERERKANEFRADGEKEAISIRAKADSRVRVILAEAEKIANKTRGEGDAKAVDIYAEAYNRNPEFYKFYRSMEAYRSSFNSKDDILVLKPDSDFFKYFKDSSASNKRNG